VANLKRVRCDITGTGVVGPSVATFYFTSAATGFPADLQTFFQAIKGNFPTGLIVTVPNNGDLIRETDGVLQGAWADSGGSTTTGTGSTNFAEGSGLRIRWVTGSLRNGRKITGTTFIVPAVSAAFTTGGLVAGATVTAVTAAGSALISAQATKIVVWSKPHSKAAADGASSAIASVSVPVQATQLRSRRV